MKNISPFASGLAYAVLLSAPAYAADFDLQPNIQTCAVSGPNGKIEVAGGKIDGEIDVLLGPNEEFDGGRFHGAISLSAPIECDFGLQIDGLVGKLDDESTWSIGGHLFARDPSSHLFGIYGEVADIGGNSINRLAVEGELYLDQITFSGVAGFEDSDFTDDDFFGVGRIAWYATDNFQLNGGVMHTLGVTAAIVGAEWQPDGSNMSLFAHAAFGDDDYSTIYGGIRFYFGGEQKSLIQRHREDDPSLWAAILQVAGDVALCPEGEIFQPTESGGFCFNPSEDGQTSE